MRRLRAVVAASALLVLLAACSLPSNTPEAYDDVTRANFLQGCIGVDVEGNSIGAGSSEAYCECAYDWISSQYPYSEETAPPGYAGITFSDLNNSLRDDPTAIPAEVSEGLSSACNQDGPIRVSPATTVAP